MEINVPRGVVVATGQKAKPNGKTMWYCRLFIQDGEAGSSEFFCTSEEVRLVDLPFMCPLAGRISGRTYPMSARGGGGASVGFGVSKIDLVEVATPPIMPGATKK